MRVLLVEDDQTAAKGLSLILKSHNAIIDHIDMGEEAVEMIRHYDYDIMVLDLMLPDIEGYEVIRRVRASRLQTPIMVLSGLSRPEARVKALGVGADDYLVKPFDRAELVARMQAVIRRSKGFCQSVLQIGPMMLNLDTHDVTINGRPVRLTGKEYQVLELLALRRGTILSKDAFLNHLYGGMDEPEMKIIDVFICKLRKKLTVAGGRGLIGTIWGQGYILREAGSEAGHPRVPVWKRMAPGVPAGEVLVSAL